MPKGMARELTIRPGTSLNTGDGNLIKKIKPEMTARIQRKQKAGR
jgi:hypothetical protein